MPGKGSWYRPLTEGEKHASCYHGERQDGSRTGSQEYSGNHHGQVCHGEQDANLGIPHYHDTRCRTDRRFRSCRRRICYQSGANASCKSRVLRFDAHAWYGRRPRTHYHTEDAMRHRNKTLAPRLPEAAREKLKSGGTHRDKKAYHRSVEKRNFERQLKDM